MTKKVPVIRQIMMRKTKAVLIDMLEQQRQFLTRANAKLEDATNRVEYRDKVIADCAIKHTEFDAKYEHLKMKHDSLNRELARKDQEIIQLKNVYMDALELNVRLLLEKE